jgi:hypothetical protein
MRARLLKEERDTFLGEHGRDDDDRRDRDRDRTSGEYGGYGYAAIFVFYIFSSRTFVVAVPDQMDVAKVQVTEPGVVVVATVMLNQAKVKEAVRAKAAVAVMVTATKNFQSVLGLGVGTEARPLRGVEAEVAADHLMEGGQVGPGEAGVEAAVDLTLTPMNFWMTRMMEMTTAAMMSLVLTNTFKRMSYIFI